MKLRLLLWLFPVLAFAQSQDLSRQDVRWYGARGDGVTDDTAAINRAVYYASISNGIARFPKGDYVMTSPLMITNSGVTLQGIGQYGSAAASRSVIRWKGTNAPCININDTAKKGLQSIRIMDLCVEGEDAAGTTGDGIYACATNGGSITEVTLERVQVQNFPGNGLHFFDDSTSYIWSCLLSDVRVHDVGSNCIHLDGTTQFRIDKAMLMTPGLDCLRINGVNNGDGALGTGAYGGPSMYNILSHIVCSVTGSGQYGIRMRHVESTDIWGLYTEDCQGQVKFEGCRYVRINGGRILQLGDSHGMLFETSPSSPYNYRIELDTPGWAATTNHTRIELLDNSVVDLRLYYHTDGAFTESDVGGAGAAFCRNYIDYMFGTTGFYFDRVNTRYGVFTHTPAMAFEVRGSGAGGPASSGTNQTGIVRMSNDYNDHVLDIGSYPGADGIWLQSTSSDDLSANRTLFLNPTNGTVHVGPGGLNIEGTLSIRTSAPPGATNSTGIPGDVAWDTEYLYMCIGTNSWKRATLSVWP